MTKSPSENLYLAQLADLYGAVSQAALVLPRWEEMALRPALRRAFHERRDDLRDLGARIEEIARRHGAPPSGIESSGVSALLAGAEEWLESNPDPSAVDLALVASARRVEHYVMAVIGMACALARALGFDADRAELERAMGDAENEDEELSRIANESLGGPMAHA